MQEEHELCLLALEANHAEPGCENTFAVCAAKQVSWLALPATAQLLKTRQDEPWSCRQLCTICATWPRG